MKKIIFFVLLNLIIINCYCDYGGEPIAFLKLKAGARATAMGGAFVAVSDNLSGVLYNPAGIIYLDGFELFSETYLLSFGRNVNFISAGKPVVIGNNIYSFALSWFNYSAGPVEMRITNSPNPLKLISDISHLFYFTMAMKLSKNIDLGGNLKFLHQATGEKNAKGLGFDIGLLVGIIDNLRFGLSIMNILTHLNWEKDPYTETAPVVYNVGISYLFKSIMNITNLDVMPAYDIIYSTYGYFLIKRGLEIKANDFFYIRVGLDKTITAGAGLKFKPNEIFIVKFDYAISEDAILQDNFNNRISLAVDYIFQLGKDFEIK